MRKHLVLWVGAVLLAASAAWAADEESGRITSIDPTTNTITIQTDDGDRIVYRTESSTKLMRDDGRTVSMSDFSVGQRVEVTAPEAEGATQRVASQIELKDSEAGEADARMGAEAGAGVRAGESGVGAEVGAEAGAGAGEGGARVGGEAEVGAGGAGVGARAGADVDVDTDDDRMARADRLPGTASPLPLLGLIGAGAMASGLVLRRIRR